MTPKLMHLRFLAGHIFITNYQSIQINRQLFFLKKKKNSTKVAMLHTNSPVSRALITESLL